MLLVAPPDFGGACGTTGFPGAIGPGRCVCRWAAARPLAVRAASFARRVVSKPGQALPPPTGTAAGPAAVSNRVALVVCVSSWLRRRPPALQQVPRRSPIGRGLSLFVASALIAHRLAISHVIPLRLLQIMNWRRCNCNVCGRSPKVTVGNYVRLLFSLGPAAAHWHRGQALRALRRPPHRRRCVADVWLGASYWSPPWPRRPPILPRQFRMQFPFSYFKV